MDVQFGQLVAWESAELTKEIHFFRMDSHISQIHVKLTKKLTNRKIFNLTQMQLQKSSD